MLSLQKSFLLVISILSFTQQTIAQEWEYLVENEYTNVIGNSWIATDGKIYSNIKQGGINNGFDVVEPNNYLLVLDKKGKTAGVVKVGACNNKGGFLPFAGDKFIVAGRNCETGLAKPFYENDIRLFDQSGQLLKKGADNIGNFHFNRTVTDKGIISLNRGNHSSFASWSISEITADFDYKEYRINLRKFQKEGWSFNPGLAKGLWLEGTTMVVPFNYALRNKDRRGGDRVKNSLLLKLNKDSVIWHFPKENKYVKIAGVQQVGENFAVVSTKYPRRIDYFLLNSDGQEIKRMILKPIGFFAKLLIHQNEIIILSESFGTQGIALHLTRYDMEGNEIGHRQFYEDTISHTQDVFPFGENSIIVTGNLKYEDKRSVFIRKIDLDKGEDKPLEEKVTDSEASIETISIDELDDTALAVSVFPNPATIIINIAIKEGYDPNGKYLLRIFTANGKQVREEIFSENPLEVEVASLTAGTYIYQIARLDKPDGRLVSGKFLKV